tara:strand:- start:596 stop:1246 length:651 start_codon:yes stop_codon:yes gene_type:complete
MATTIVEVQGESISPITLIDLQLGATTYYISSNWKPVTVDGNNYSELGAFLSVSNIDDNLKYNANDLALTLSGIPSGQDYLRQILDNPVKGGNVTLKRAFVDSNTMELKSGVYTRFKGVITNYKIDEQVNILSKQMDYAVTVTLASQLTVLSEKITGQRTNPEDRKRIFSADKSFNRVPILFNTAFDFGKEYTGGTGGYGRGGRRGDGNRQNVNEP